MRAGLKLMIAALVCLAALGACNKADPDADKVALRALVEKDTTHFAGGTKGDSTAGLYVTDDTMIGIWWRGPQTHDSMPVIEIGLEGDSAWVAWHQHNYGELFHWVRTSETTAVRWVKDLTETVQLNAIFKRDGKPTDTERGWKLKKISFVDGTSKPANTVRIDSMRIRSQLRDLLITDPLNAFYPVDSLIWFTPGEQLTITLYTNADEGFAFLHAFLGLLFIRIPFNDMGDGVFTGTWNAQIIPGFRFAIFDVMTKSTLLSPEAPYDFKGWLMPYWIKTAD